MMADESQKKKKEIQHVRNNTNLHMEFSSLQCNKMTKNKSPYI